MVFEIISGDLFDCAYPPIDILKGAFIELRKLHDSKIPCFIVAGSHDYSVSGKTFLDVLEKAGFCKNVTSFDPETSTSEQRNEKIILNPRQLFCLGLRHYVCFSERAQTGKMFFNIF